MVKKIIGLLVFLFIIFNFNTVYGSDRVILSSIPAEVWSNNVYLIADKLNWMDYENFTVQIGNMGELVYDFPNWYHGKYEPELYKVDLNNDTLKDIVAILNNDRGSMDKPRKEIHILNEVVDPYRRYEEAEIETIPQIIRNYIKFQQESDVITIKIHRKTYKVDLNKFKYDNPHEPYVSLDSLEYHIEDGNLIGEMMVKVVVDDRATGGIIGTVKIKYGFENGMYKAKYLNFISLI